MFVSGADLRFVAAAVQSWSLPHPPTEDGKHRYARLNVTRSIAVILLAGIAKLGQRLLAEGTWAWKAALAWLILEVCYFILCQSRYASVSRVVDVPLDEERVELIKRRFLTLSAVMPMEDFLSGWFQGAPAQEIKRRNVEDFVAYGFYCRHLEQLSPKLMSNVVEFVCEVEKAYGQRLVEGYNPDIHFMAHLWEPLRALHTPLSIHCGSLCAGLSANLVLAIMGFQKLSCEGLGYWYRPGKSQGPPIPTQGRAPRIEGMQTRSMTDSVHSRGDSASSVATFSAPQEPVRPLVFIHGVGFGILPYLGFLWTLLKENAQHPAVLLDVPHVALRPLTRAKSVDAIAASVQQLLSRHCLGPACFVGHSFGTFCVSRICQLHPDSVDSIALLDPVCCLTCYPQLLSSFVYKKFSLREATSSINGFSNTIRFIFSRDLIIAETFCRQFLWHSLMLWPDDMPTKTFLSVSANDDLVPAELVRAHLAATKSSAAFICHPTAAHGGIFLDPAHLRHILDHVGDLLRS